MPDRMHLQVALGRLDLVGGLSRKCASQGHFKNESSHCVHFEKVKKESNSSLPLGHESAAQAHRQRDAYR